MHWAEKTGSSAPGGRIRPRMDNRRGTACCRGCRLEAQHAQRDDRPGGPGQELAPGWVFGSALRDAHMPRESLAVLRALICTHQAQGAFGRVAPEVVARVDRPHRACADAASTAVAARAHLTPDERGLAHQAQQRTERAQVAAPETGPHSIKRQHPYEQQRHERSCRVQGLHRGQEAASRSFERVDRALQDGDPVGSQFEPREDRIEGGPRRGCHRSHEQRQRIEEQQAQAAEGCQSEGQSEEDILDVAPSRPQVWLLWPRFVGRRQVKHRPDGTEPPAPRPAKHEREEQRGQARDEQQAGRLPARQHRGQAGQRVDHQQPAGRRRGGRRQYSQRCEEQERDPLHGAADLVQRARSGATGAAGHARHTRHTCTSATFSRPRSISPSPISAASRT